MRASRSSGSVGERGGNEPLYPERTIDNIYRNFTTIQRGDLLSCIYLFRIHTEDIYTRDIIIR